MQDSAIDNLLKGLAGVKLSEITFPEFWTMAQKRQNRFYRYVLDEAKQHVSRLGLEGKWLEEGAFQKFWHRHCELCWREITVDTAGSCGCTEDCYVWLCPDCFAEFTARHVGTVEKADDIPASGVVRLGIQKEDTP